MFLCIGSSKIPGFKTYYNNLKSNVEDLGTHCMDFDSFFSGLKAKQIIKALHKLKDYFHSS